MTIYKQALCAFLLVLFSSTAFVSAQESPSPNTNSPYTRYGFGQLSDQSFGNSKAMGGIAYGLRNGSQINPSNPASYTSIDSLTFLFEGGMTMQNTNFKDGKIRMNAKNSSFDYIAMQFRLNKKLAMSAGFLPFSSVGYSFSQTGIVNDKTDPDNPKPSDYNYVNSFSGDGGLNQLYAGIAYKIINNLSVGINASYLFGTINHASQITIANPNENNINVDVTSYSNQVKINNYKLDFGLQYTQKFGKKHAVTLGAVYSLKHKLNSDGYKYVTNQGKLEGVTTSISSSVDTIRNGFEMPHSFGAGLTYVYDNRLTVGFDYTFQKWGETKFFNEEGMLSDRAKYAFGVEYLPSFIKRNYLTKIRYRAGVYYSDPYVKVKGENGAREFGASLGFGLPVMGSKSILSISGQYVKVKPRVKGMLEENYLKLSIGLTFNERWFSKWKVQ